MIINSHKYTADLIILPDRIQSNWRRQKGHQLSVKDLTILDCYSLQCLVIGTGAFGVMQVPARVKKQLAVRGMEVIIEKTGTAVTAFNKKKQEETAVAGAFHLTC